MLVLGRNVGEKIIVNEDLIIYVSSITNRNGRMQVKLAFESSKEKYIVDRYEIFERKVIERGE